MLNKLIEGLTVKRFGEFTTLSINRWHSFKGPFPDPKNSSLGSKYLGTLTYLLHRNISSQKPPSLKSAAPAGKIGAAISDKTQFLGQGKSFSLDVYHTNSSSLQSGTVWKNLNFEHWRQGQLFTHFPPKSPTVIYTRFRREKTGSYYSTPVSIVQLFLW